MKLFTIALLTGLLALLPAVSRADDLGMARIGLVSGDVQISVAGAGEWLPAAINTPVQQGDRIWVPEGGRSEVRMRGGVITRLDAMTSLDVLTLNNASLQFFMNGGRVYLNNRNRGIDVVQVDTPLSSVTCYGRSRAQIDVYGDGATDVAVVRGQVYVETQNGKTRVPPGSTLRIGQDLRADIFPSAPPDEWAAWNRDRDRRLADITAYQRYLPAELADYGPDLDQNGRWIETPDYGYVWTPTVSVSADWAPYRVGKWAWIGGSFVWVSYESWGWTPYHYGRWAFVPRTGWCWVPPRREQVYWSPGYVAWVQTPSAVSWVPLAPGDTYYGRGYYGPNSVNITNVTKVTNVTNVNITNINVSRVSRNIQVTNAVTVLPRDAFISGSKADFKVRENPFTQRHAVFGPPAVKPGIATMAPVIKAIPSAKLPPPQVKQVSIQAVRQERKLARNERASVFRPGSQAREVAAVTHKAPVKLPTFRKPGPVVKLPPKFTPAASITPVATQTPVRPGDRPVFKATDKHGKVPASGAPALKALPAPTTPSTPMAHQLPVKQTKHNQPPEPQPAQQSPAQQFRRSLPPAQQPRTTRAPNAQMPPAPVTPTEPQVFQPSVKPVKRSQPPVQSSAQQPPAQQFRQYQPPAQQPRVTRAPALRAPNAQTPPASATPRAPQPPAQQFKLRQPLVQQPAQQPPAAAQKQPQKKTIPPAEQQHAGGSPTGGR